MIDKDLSAAIAAKLATLGTTPDEVAAALEAEGCKGWRGLPASCPVAKYLNKLGWQDVSVASTTYIFAEDGGMLAHFALPWAVANFFEGFDNRRYPNLIES
jgi:hypothetical protein